VPELLLKPSLQRLLVWHRQQFSFGLYFHPMLTQISIASFQWSDLLHASF
jgi:hypothetical protein